MFTAPFKSLANFVSMVFCKILSCFFCLSSEDKSLKEQRAVLVELQEKFEDAVLSSVRDTPEVAAYQGAVQALAPEQRASILAKLVDNISQIPQFSDPSYQPRLVGMATKALDGLTDVTARPVDGETFGRVAFAAVPAVRAALAEMVQAIDAKLA